MEYIRCPICKRVKFVDTDGEVLWLELNVAEEMVISIILLSDPLLLIAGGVREEQEHCCHCKKRSCN